MTIDASPPTASPSDRLREPAQGDCSTLEVARQLGMAVRSVQLMVDRGELTAWRTPGGHRRIARRSVEAWLARREQPAEAPAAGLPAMTLSMSPALTAARPTPAQLAPAKAPRILLIEDSAHHQNLVRLLVRQTLPQAELHTADDGIAGLAMAGRLSPDVLIVDILLPGIDGATLITSLRSQEPFAGCHLIVVTSLDADQRGPYAFALQGLSVIHKDRLVAELPGRLIDWSQSARNDAAAGPPPAA
jgi:excisionase family DNA binding protein